VGFYRCVEQDKSARDQSNQIEQENGRPEVQSESKEAVDDDVKSEQDHSDSFHADI
jgi:hypothetical protein